MLSGANLGILFGLGVLAITVISIAWHYARPDKIEQWPVTEGTIQSTSTEQVREGRGSRLIEVCDFSYTVGDEYYSGRLTVGRLDGEEDHSSRGLIGRKIQVRYDPQKPDKFSVATVELDGFSLGQHYESPFSNDTEPTDLNLDKN